MQDGGLVEPKVVRGFEGVEKQWPGGHIMNVTSCADAMLKAIEAARAGFDKKSYKIAYACQAYNKDAQHSYAAAGFRAVAEFLRKQVPTGQP
jgi:hypothetical protein